MNMELQIKRDLLMAKIEAFNGDHTIVVSQPERKTTMKDLKRKLNFINKRLLK